MPTQTAVSTPHAEQSHAAVASELTIGLIVLSTDTLTELELRRMLPDDNVNFSATRIKNQEPGTIETLRAHVHEIAKAGNLYDPPGAVNVFAYACTSGSVIISQEKLESELHRSLPRSHLTSPMTGALRAFRRLGVKRVSMLSPYGDDVVSLMTQCLNEWDVAVLSSASFHSKTDEEIIAISPQSILDAACSIDQNESEAIFIPCTALRTSSIIQMVEARLGKPVVTAHQAMLWDALRIAGYEKPIAGYGRLLTL
ncbi:maleate cis-trans isomerase family protein [Rhizobium jaguaris]|uniref:Asp/Glu racemase n=1 Tax=Rhizobium jaguaris TaxID=1312183 RepID=A0A387G7G2_9HYPH|nr:Asp/Glu racemase [Rhizobium jaguaris]AYG64104.1 Asp/Glu racemase [Rhizobium jaguaris]